MVGIVAHDEKTRHVKNRAADSNISFQSEVQDEDSNKTEHLNETEHLNMCEKSLI